MKATKQNPSFTSYSIPISSGVKIKLHLCRIHEIGCVARMHARGVDLTLVNHMQWGHHSFNFNFSYSGLGSVNNCPTQLRQRFNDSRRQTLFWWGNDSPRIGQILGKLHETARKRDVCYVCPVICIAIYCKTQREPIAFQTRGRGGQQLPGYPTWNVTVQLPCDYWSQAKLHHQPL